MTINYIGMTRIVKDDDITGFRVLGTWEYELDYDDFSRIEHLDVTWKCDFPKK